MSNWSLRLLSDPYMDVGIALDDGQHILGSDDDSDLVIASDTVLPQHICLHITQGAAELTVLDTSQPIYVNGVAIEGNNCSLTARDVVTLGTFSFTLGTEDDDLSTVSVPDLEPPAHQVTGDKEHDDTRDANLQETPTTATESNVISQPASLLSKLHLTRRSIQMGSLVVGGLLVLSVVLIPWLMSGANAKAVEVLGAEDSLTPQMLLSNLSEELELSDLRVNTQSGSVSWVIEGYVDNVQQQRQLRHWLSEHHPTFNDNVMVMSNLISGARATLEALGHGNIVVSNDNVEPGILVLQGVVQDAVQWHAVLRQLENDVNGANWRDEVEVHRQYASPDVIVKSVSLGRHPFFIGGNGKKYFIGSVYGEGYSVEAIELSHIVMRQGGNMFKYNLATY